MKKLNIILIAFSLFLISSQVFGQLKGYAFLRHATSARSAALGNAFLAIEDDPVAVFTNPAAIAGIKQRHGVFTFTNYLLDIKRGSGVYIHPREKDNIAFSFRFQDYGSLDGRDALNESTGEFGANSVVLQASYASQYTNRIWYGGTVKYFRSEIDTYSSDGFAVDLALYYSSTFFENMKFGLGVFNLGTINSKYTDYTEELPTSVEFGVSKPLAHLPFEWSVALRQYLQEDFIVSVGGEFTLNKSAFLRLGYNSNGSDQKVVFNGNRLAGFSAGFGISANQIRFDYGFATMGALGSANLFTLGYNFK